MKHELKILKCYLEPKLEGLKLFEIRINDDRGFQKGDKVVFVENASPRRRTTEAEITYVTSYHQQPSWVVFGHTPVEVEA